jgi:hypothetical protein
VKDIQVDKVTDQKVMQCSTFAGGIREDCTACGHRWQDHLHVLWKVIRRSVKVQDEAVIQSINENAPAADIVKTALRSRKERVEKYCGERAFIRKAASRFCLYLDTTSVKPVDFATREYLDQLIEEERGKVQAGGNVRRLCHLRVERQQHVDEVKSLLSKHQGVEARAKSLKQDDVDAMIKQLYELELVGPELKLAVENLQKIERAASHGFVKLPLAKSVPAKRKLQSS